MYTDEGYLLHTLPVTKHEILASKILVGGLWVLIIVFSMYLSLFLLGLSMVWVILPDNYTAETGKVAESHNAVKGEVYEGSFHVYAQAGLFVNGSVFSSDWRRKRPVILPVSCITPVQNMQKLRVFRRKRLPRRAECGGNLPV